MLYDEFTNNRRKMNSQYKMLYNLCEDVRKKVQTINQKTKEMFISYQQQKQY